MTDSDIIRIDCTFHKKNKSFVTGEIVTGQLRVKVAETIQYNQFIVRLQYKVTGRMSTHSKTFPSQLLAGNGQFEPDQDYTFDFSLQIDSLPSIEGENMELVWYVETDLDLTEESKSELRDRFIGEFKLLKWVNPEKGLDASFPVHVTLPPQAYLVRSQKGEIKSEQTLALLIGSLFGVIIIIAGLIIYLPVGIFLLLGGIGLLITVYLKLEKVKKLGKILFKISSDEGKGFHFLLKVQHQASHLDHLLFKYYVKEIVVDDRGTSSSTFTHTLFESPPEKAVLNPSNEAQTYHSFPSRQLPPTLSVGDASIRWDIEVTFVFKDGQKSTRTAPFFVDLDMDTTADFEEVHHEIFD